MGGNGTTVRSGMAGEGLEVLGLLPLDENYVFIWMPDTDQKLTISYEYVDDTGKKVKGTKELDLIRSIYGAYQNRLEHTIANLAQTEENLAAAESRIRDADMAKEMMHFAKASILTEAAQSMLAQARQNPNQVTELLQGI